MRPAEYAVHDLLRPFVRSIWGLEMEAGDAQPTRIVPDGIVELVFHYRTPFAMRFADGRFSPQPTSFAVSQVRRFLEIQPRSGAGFIAVRFEPWGVQHFQPVSVRDLADGLVGVEDLWGAEGAEIEERLALAAGKEERHSLLERFLLFQLAKHRRADVGPLVREVWRHRGQVRVADLCKQVGVGERSLERLFSRALGMPPKSYARLCRFLFACRELAGSNSTSLTEIGYGCGYYDQAHFIGDFRAYSGLTPGEFRARGDVSFLELD